MLIKVNNALVHPMLFRISMIEGVSVEVSEEIVGFSIEKDGEEVTSGESRRDFHFALRDLMRELRSS